MIYNFVIVGLLSYLIGSIPFSYILTKLFYKLDLSKLGSENLGARNSYEVTGKKWLGILVLILDMTKGILAVIFAGRYYTSFDFAFFAASFAVLGHNYSVFMKFKKGGRGFATTAGALLLTIPLAIPVWLILYLFSKIISKNVHLDSVIATFLTPIIFLLQTNDFFYRLNYINSFSEGYYYYFVILLFLIILSKHYKPLREYFQEKKG